MAKSAPEPVRNSLGDVVGPWNVTIAYDDASDSITLFARKPGTRWLKEKRWSVSYAPDEVEEALEALLRIVRSASCRRLF